MANISATMVKELRESTGAGMMDCKAALTENDGDMQAAVDWLRKKGLSKAAKKAGRVATEGLIGALTEGTKGVVVEVNSETDFVARNEQFQGLVKMIAQVALKTGGDVAAINAAPVGEVTVERAIADAIATIGENMTLRRAAEVSVPAGAIGSYVHNAVSEGLGKIGVLVGLESSGQKDELTALGRQVAMHVAASKPLAVDPSHPFPYISNLALSIAAMVADPESEDGADRRFVRVKVPTVFPRLVEVDEGKYLPVEDLIIAMIDEG